MLGGWTPGPCPLGCKGPSGAFQEMGALGPSSLGHTGLTLRTALASGPCSLSSLSSPAGEHPTLRYPHFEETPHFLESQVRNSEPWPAVDGPGPLDQSSLPCAQGIALLDPKGISSPPPQAQLCPLPRQLASPSPITGAGSHLAHAQKVPGHSVPRIYKDILKAR